MNGLVADEISRLRSDLRRIDARLQIQQLPARYAMAIDARDLDAVVALFDPEVDCGRRGRGREALKAQFRGSTANFYRSIHQIVGHCFDLVDDDKATGRVYCRAEHEYGDKWIVAALCYFDTYRRIDDQWLFAAREVDFFYCADHLERPQDVDFSRWATPEMRFSPPMMLPRFEHWAAFWDAQDAGKVAALTRHS